MRKDIHKTVLFRILAGVAGVLLFLLIIGASVFLGLRIRGKEQLYSAAVESAPSMDTGELTEEEQTQEEWKEGRIRYQGELYDYNQDILTFLVMGIDSRDSKVVEKEEGIDGGQADTIFLVVLNPHDSRMRIIAIDRNTMADVDIYGELGAYVETVKTQIAVQHGFGDGTVKSAGYMVKAVSRLFSDLPIHGYCAVNMSAIGKINDAVGGVTLTVMEDINTRDVSLKAGESVCLTADEAYWYARYRDEGEFGSSASRLARQRQFLEALVNQGKARFKKDASLPVTVFNALSEYMTTDITVDKATYLASVASQYSFTQEDMLTVPGETRMGEIYEEFYVDEAGMRQLIIDIFYEKVE